MSFRCLLPTFRDRQLALIAALALALAGCGGGGGSAGSASTGGSGNASGPAFELGAFQDLVSPSGATAISNAVDALAIGDLAVVRSDSAAVSGVIHPSTRFSMVDSQGKVTASVDLGLTLAGGYAGDWVMLPSAGGFALLQASNGSKLYQFDAQAKLIGPAAGIDLYAMPSGDKPPTITGNAAVADGNGIWVATTLAYPQADFSNVYRLNLTKIDWNGKALTPTAPIWTSSKPPLPSIAASAGAVILSWSDAGSPKLAVWPQGAGLPAIKGVGSGSGAFGFRPLALNGSGKLGLFWTEESDPKQSGNLAGVAFDGSGAALISPGGSATAWDAEVLSSTWNGRRRQLNYDLRAANGTLYVADVVDDPNALGDTIVLADYAVSDAALATVTPRLLRSLRGPTAMPLGTSGMLRQMIFSDHALLLVSDNKHAEAAVVTRR